MRSWRPLSSVLLSLLAACSGQSEQDLDGDGFTVAGGDCDDTDPAVHPGATEIWYDGIDQDCSGGRDDDQDGDGFASWRVGGPDCYDTFDDDYPTPTDGCWKESARAKLRPEEIYPGATDAPYDATDADCSGGTDADADGDGFTICAEVDSAADCDDNDPTVHPGAEEGVADGVDSNCDGMELCYWDFDEDGYGVRRATLTSSSLSCDGSQVSPYATDCDESNPYTYPGAAEWCDFEDNDCDGVIDEPAGSATLVTDEGFGTYRDMSAELTGEVTIPTGTLYLCAGSWNVELRASEAGVEIRGLGAGVSVIDTQGAGTPLTVSGGSAVVRDLTLTGGAESGVVVSDAGVWFHSVSIERNTGRYGGAIAAYRSNVHLEGSTLADNSVSLGGGAITASAARVGLIDCEVESNAALDGGAAWLFDGSDLKVERGTWSGNVALDEGGAVYLDHSTATFTHAALRDNSAATGGGGAWLGPGGDEDTTFSSSDSDWGANLAAGIDADIDGHLFDAPYAFEGTASFTCGGRGACY